MSLQHSEGNVIIPQPVEIARGERTEKSVETTVIYIDWRPVHFLTGFLCRLDRKKDDEKTAMSTMTGK